MTALISLVLNFIKFALFIDKADKAEPEIRADLEEWEQIIEDFKAIVRTIFGE